MQATAGFHTHNSPSVALLWGFASHFGGSIQIIQYPVFVHHPASN
jgi:hypothetical protein